MPNRIPHHYECIVLDTSKIHGSLIDFEKAVLQQLSAINKDGMDDVTVRRRYQLHRLLTLNKKSLTAYCSLLTSEFNYRDQVTKSGRYAVTYDELIDEILKH